MYESILLISGSSLFHSFIEYGEKQFLEISVLHSAQQVWRFIRRILQVQTRIQYLRLPIDSAGHCVRYANVKVFSKPIFPVYGKMRTGQNLYICIFYPVWRISIISSETHTLLNKNNRQYTEHNIVDRFLVKQLLRFC